MGRRRHHRSAVIACIIIGLVGAANTVPAAATTADTSELDVEIPYLRSVERRLPDGWVVTACPASESPNLVHLSCVDQRVIFTADAYLSGQRPQLVDLAFDVDGMPRSVSYSVSLAPPLLQEPLRSRYGYPLAQGAPTTIPYAELPSHCEACTDSGPAYSDGAVEPGTAGTVEFSGTGLLFAAAPDFSGDATLSFIVRDPVGQESDRSEITVSVVPGRSSAPIIVNDSVVTDAGAAARGDVLDNDIHEPDVRTVVESCSTPAHGTVTCDASGSYVYTPDPGFAGLDQFAYHLSTPESGDQAVGSVVVGVAADPTATLAQAPASEAVPPFAPPPARRADASGVLGALRDALTRLTTATP